MLNTLNQFLKNIPLFLFLMGATLPIFAQTYLSNIQKFSVEEGLSGRYVVGIQEDEKGFIWISTWRGLNRFDGFEFKEYPSAEYGFKLDRITQILKDPLGKIWLVKITGDKIPENGTTQQHIDIFNPVTETLENESFYGKMPFTINDVKHILNDENQNIWIGLSSGEIYRYDGKALELKIKTPPFFKFEFVSSDLILTLGLNKKTIQFYNLKNELLNQVTLDCDFIYFQPDKNGKVLTLCSSIIDDRVKRKLFLLSPKDSIQTITFVEDGKPYELDHYVNDDILKYDLSIDRNKNIWITYNSISHQFDENYKFVHRFDLKEKYPETGSNELYFDRQNNAWLPTSDGIFILNLQKNPFSNFLNKKSNLMDTRGIAEDDLGNIYVNQNKTYKLSKNQQEFQPIGLRGKRAAYFTKAKKILLGDYSSSLIEYNPETGESIQLTYPNQKIYNSTSGATIAIHQSKKTGTIYLGTAKKGISLYRSDEKMMVTYEQVNEFDYLQNLAVNCFVETQEGTWLGTSDGFFLMDEEKGILQHHTLNKKDAPAISVLSIHVDYNGLFWIGTFNHGLYQWSPTESTIRHLTEKDGLPDNTIYAVYEDEFKNLWMPTNKGLMQMDKNDLSINTYLPSDGIPHQEFNASSHLRTKDGRFFFGGLKGVTAFYPKNFTENSEQKNLYRPTLSQVRIRHSDSIKWEDVSTQFWENKSIQLSNDIKEVEINLAAFDMVNADQNQFAYRLLPSEEWTFLEKNKLELNKLPTGNSTVEIKGRTRNSAWSDAPLEIKISRKYPFYFRIPFILGVLFVIALVAYFARQRKKRLIQKQNKKIANAIEVIRNSMDLTSKIPDDKPSASSNTSEEEILEEKEKIKKEDFSGKRENAKEEEAPNTADQEWLKMLNRNANLLIENNKFSIVELAATMNLGERQFRRVLKQKTNLRPADYLREIRLLKAKKFLKEGKFATVAEVCYAVGFSTPKHFSRLFKDRFGKNPSEYLENNSPNSSKL